MSSSQYRQTGKLILLTGALALIGGGMSYALSGGPDRTTASPTTDERVSTYATSAALGISAPERVVGSESCKECHKSEYAAWTETKHSKNFARIDSDSGKKIAQQYGGTEACQQCHSTPHTDTAKFATAEVGVSCESCHSPAGGPDGWLKVHSDYGGKDLKRTDETEAHLKERLAKCDEAGMIRPSKAYDLARNCFSCHIVSDEKLLAAGHKAGQSDFDLIAWMQGEVRHNFQVDQKVNAESPSLLKARYGTTAEQRKRILLVVNKMAELEALLRNLGTISPGSLKEKYAGRRGWAGRAEEVFESLDEEVGEAIDNEQVKAAVDVVKGIELGRKFKDQEAAKEAADKLAQIARDFAQSNDGSGLEGLDELIDDLDKPVGKLYTP